MLPRLEAMEFLPLEAVSLSCLSRHHSECGFLLPFVIFFVHVSLSGNNLILIW